jgi:hypothetical protein
MIQLLAAHCTSNLPEKHLAIANLETMGQLTFGLLESICITLQFVDGFVVFIFFDAIMHNPSTSLVVCNTIFEKGRSDRYACIHRVVRKIEPTDPTSVHPTTLLFQTIYELDCLYLWSSRDSACGEY